MAGHLFITRSDLTRLHCDAWLLPTSRGFHVVRGWPLRRAQRATISALERSTLPHPEGWSRSGVRVRVLREGRLTDNEPFPVLANVGRSFEAPVEWYLEGVLQFLDKSCVLDRITHSRERRLLAVPLVGTGSGGMSAAKGGVIDALVPFLATEAERREIDIALVLRDEPAFVAAQNVRRTRLGDLAWRELSERQIAEAQRLAVDAAAGRLVIFAGAGVSAGAGLPTWTGLLADLADRVGVTDGERAALDRFPMLDRANLLRNRCAEKGMDIGAAICERLSTRWFSLAHSLLAGLPVAEFVTTNYDDLLERASVAAGNSPAILPYQPVSNASRWILTLHGSCAHPDDIVLTREDYLRYADRRAALGAIVQAMLITRHMLFVGFSLTDDNFHRIVDEVRKALHGSSSARSGAEQFGTHATGASLTRNRGAFGTALLLGDDPLMRQLWAKDLSLFGFGATVDTHAEAARLMEVFLDLVLAEASRGVSPILDPAYDGVLTHEEREIAAALRDLELHVSSGARHSPAWAPVAALLRRLGASVVE